MAKKAYTNHNLIINGEVIRDVHLSVSNPDIDLDVLFDIIVEHRASVKAEAWKAKATITGLNALLTKSTSDEVDIVM